MVELLYINHLALTTYFAYNGYYYSCVVSVLRKKEREREKEREKG